MTLIDEVMEGVSEYVEQAFKPSNKVKLLWSPGGDYYIFDDLNKVFMMAPPEVHTFVEVFGGSCWCSLNVSRQKFKIIVANDIDSALMTFYKLVRDDPEGLMKRLSILPFSREIHRIAREIVEDPKADAVTKAVMLFYLSRTSMFGTGGFAVSKGERQLAKDLATVIAMIKEFAKKFRDVVLENKDFREVIKLYDSPRTLFYLDPPYVSATEDQGRESYFRYPFTQGDLWSMAATLKTVKGYWVLKVAEDNYLIIKEVLPQHEVLPIEKFKSFQKVVGGGRPKWRLVIAHNIKSSSKPRSSGSQTDLSRWLTNPLPRPKCEASKG